MVFCPDSLVWELTKHQSSFLNQKNGSTKRTGSITFSSEKGNIKNLNQFKFSGLANSKVYDIECTKESGAVLIVKTASKAATQPNKAKATIPMNKDFRRVEAAMKKNTSDVFYRRDLESAALAKWTKVYQANRRAKKIKKPITTKKGRGSN